MAEGECSKCDVDALGRHDPYCSRANTLGLPRRAEGEEPIVPDQPTQEMDMEIPHDESYPSAEHPMSYTEETEALPPHKLCVACLDYHIDPDAEKDATPVGKSLIHPDCRWRVDYSDLPAHKIIAALEHLLLTHSDQYGGYDAVRFAVQAEIDG